MQTPIGFTDFKDGERVVAVVRHHWWVLFTQVALLILFFFLPFFLVPIVFAFAVAGGSAPALSGGAVVFFASAWALIIWNLLFARWTDYYFDIWIITNWRIIDIDQRGFFNRDVTTLLDLDHIQDINTKTLGIIGNLLNFGTLMLQTAGAKVEFLIDEVPNPQRVERLIREAQLEHAHDAQREKALSAAKNI